MILAPLFVVLALAAVGTTLVDDATFTFVMVGVHALAVVGLGCALALRKVPRTLPWVLLTTAIAIGLGNYLFVATGPLPVTKVLDPSLGSLFDTDMGVRTAIERGAGFLRNLLTVTALLLLLRLRTRQVTKELLADGWILASAGAAVSWTVFGLDQQRLHHASDAAMVAINGAIALCMLAAVVYAAAIRSNRSPESLALLAAGGLVGMANLSRIAAAGYTWHPLPRYSAMFQAVAACVLVALAYSPNVGRLARRSRAPQPKHTALSLGTLFALALAVSPTAASREIDISASLDATWMVCSISLICAVAVRVALVLSAQRAVEDALAARAREQGLVAELGRRALEGASPVEMMHAASTGIRAHLDVEVSAVFELLVQNRALLLRVADGLDGRPDEVIVPEDSTTDVRLALDDRLATGAPNAFAHLGMQSSLCTAIHGPDLTLGVLAVFSATPRTFGESERNFLRSIANILGTAISRATSESELHQAQKLESVGRLAAGIAHEINTPVQFVGDNLHFIQDAFGEVRQLLEAQSAALAALDEGTTLEELRARMAQLNEDHNVEYLLDEVPDATTQALDGVNRVATIVRAMKAFGHPDGQEQTLADINQALSNTVTVARNEIKYVADVETRFGNLPPVRCRIGELNQVFLNLIVNGAHAIEEVVKAKGGRGQITIQTWHDKTHAYVAIADTGGGIPKEIRERVFEPFFTTKEVGKGTGQGLALARNVVLQHGGRISFDSDENGTIFCIKLPLEGIPAETPQVVPGIAEPDDEASFELSSAIG